MIVQPFAVAQKALPEMPFLAKAERAQHGDRGAVGRCRDSDEAVDRMMLDQIVDRRRHRLARIAMAMMVGMDAIAELDLLLARDAEADADRPWRSVRTDPGSQAARWCTHHGRYEVGDCPT